MKSMFYNNFDDMNFGDIGSYKKHPDNTDPDEMDDNDSYDMDYEMQEHTKESQEAQYRTELWKYIMTLVPVAAGGALAGYLRVFIWFASVLMVFAAVDLGRRMYQSVGMYYPEKALVTPKRCSGLFSYAEKVPREICKGIYIHICGLIIQTVILVITFFLGRKSFSGWRILFLMPWYLIPGQYVMIIRLHSVCWHDRFKKVTRKNFKYFARFFALNDMENAPEPAFMGKCGVISARRKRRRRELTVKLTEDGRKIDKVWAPKGMKIERGQNYPLYEICGVRYLEQATGDR